VVDIKNKNILNIARNMLKTKKMSKEFWAEAVDCVVYLLNRHPMKGLNDMTPQEAWNGRKPSDTQLRVFGTIDYVYVNDQIKAK
jgi:hypothetical protein